ncbi:MAG: acyltransferase family protein, partial [Bacteroidia bacterium]|nr:acyltransferase family protein [Bacteroidia bacterium]
LRTLPNYYLILIINIILLYYLHDMPLKGVPAFFLFLQNFSSGQMDFFTESWSLSIEEFAYIIGPMLLLIFFFFFKKTDKTRILLLVTIIIIVLITIFRLIFHLNEEVENQAFWSQDLRKVVIYRIDSIYYGFVAAYISTRFKHSWKNYRFGWMIAGAGLFIAMHLVIFKFSWLPENSSFFYNLLYLPLVSISIALFLPFLDSWRKSTILRPTITWISLLSYSLYLVNYSILLLTIEKYVDVSSMSLLGKCIMALLFWVVSFMLSYALFRWYEKPFMNLRDKPLILNKFKQE